MMAAWTDSVRFKECPCIRTPTLAQAVICPRTELDPVAFQAERILHTVLLPRAPSAEAVAAGLREEAAEVAQQAAPPERDPTPPHPAVPEFVQVCTSSTQAALQPSEAFCAAEFTACHIHPLSSPLLSVSASSPSDLIKKRQCSLPSYLWLFLGAPFDFHRGTAMCPLCSLRRRQRRRGTARCRLRR